MAVAGRKRSKAVYRKILCYGLQKPDGYENTDHAAEFFWQDSDKVSAGRTGGKPHTYYKPIGGLRPLRPPSLL